MHNSSLSYTVPSYTKSYTYDNSTPTPSEPKRTDK